MSKFALQLMEKDTGKKKIIQSMDSRHYLREDKTNLLSTKIYDIGVKFGVTVSVPDDELGKFDPDKANLKTAIQVARRQIVEEVFGEFRGPILELHLAIFERDFYRAKNILVNLERQMFFEGLE